VQTFWLIIEGILLIMPHPPQCYGTCLRSTKLSLTQATQSAALIVSSALMSWKTLILLTGSESPIVVVLSGSMEPAFYRGDILFLNMGSAPLRTGEIVVYNLAQKDIPIVHRIIQVHEKADGHEGAGTTEILTKVWAEAMWPMGERHASLHGVEHRGRTHACLMAMREILR
jgi:Peptidase S24-like